MTRIYLKLLGLPLLAVPLLAAVPHQEGLLGDLPWWIWLVVVTFLLLLLFVVIVAFDWGSGTEANVEDE